MLPYVVKGMDVSFSGILSHLEEQVGSAFMEQGVCTFKVVLICCIVCVCDTDSVSVIENMQMMSNEIKSKCKYLTWKPVNSIPILK